MHLSIYNYCILVFSTVFLFGIGFNILSKLLKEKPIAKLFEKLAAFILVLTSIIFSLYIIIGIMYILIATFNLILEFKVYNIDLRSYLTLFVVLLIVAYLPDKIILLLYPLIEHYSIISEPNYGKVQEYKPVTYLLVNFVRFLKFKIWIYLISFIMTFISYVENYGKFILIHNQYWTNMRSIVDGAVVSFVVFDDFTAESQKILTKSSPKGLLDLSFSILWMFRFSTFTNFPSNYLF